MVALNLHKYLIDAWYYRVHVILRKRNEQTLCNRVIIWRNFTAWNDFGETKNNAHKTEMCTFFFRPRCGVYNAIHTHVVIAHVIMFTHVLQYLSTYKYILYMCIYISIRYILGPCTLHLHARVLYVLYRSNLLLWEACLWRDVPRVTFLW